MECFRVFLVHTTYRTMEQLSECNSKNLGPLQEIIGTQNTTGAKLEFLCNGYSQCVAGVFAVHQPAGILMLWPTMEWFFCSGIWQHFKTIVTCLVLSSPQPTAYEHIYVQCYLYSISNPQLLSFCSRLIMINIERCFHYYHSFPHFSIF